MLKALGFSGIDGMTLSAEWPLPRALGDFGAACLRRLCDLARIPGMQTPPPFRTLLTLAIAVPTVDEARRIMQEAAGEADAFELRIDAMDPAGIDLAALLRDRPRPVVVTNRPRWEGGSFEGSEARRLDLLTEAAALGAEHVDCEAKAVHALNRAALGQAKLIVSAHDFAAMPDLCVQWNQCAEVGAPDIVKVVGMAESVLDGLQALGVFRACTGLPTVSLAMGAPGVVSRILAPRYGAYLTFASLPRPGQETAPGQLSLDVMRRTYRAADMTSRTAVVGWVTRATNPHAASARFTQEFLALGFDAVVVPLCSAGGISLDPLLTACMSLGFRGMIVDDGAGAGRTNLGPLLRNDGRAWRPLSADAPLRLLLE